MNEISEWKNIIKQNTEICEEYAKYYIQMNENKKKYQEFLKVKDKIVDIIIAKFENEGLKNQSEKDYTE